MENSMQVPQKTKNRVTKWSCNPTPGHTSGENYNSKRYRHPNVHSSTIYNSQNMEATDCPSADEWIKNMWYKYTTEYYSAIENNEILPFAAKLDGPRDKLCLSGVCTVWVAMSCSSPQSVLRAFNSGPYPKDQGRSPRLRTQHTLTAGGCERVSRFSTGNCHLVRILWWFFFFFFGLCCPLRFQNSPLTQPERGFPIVRKLLLHYSLPRRDLLPGILCLSLRLYLLSYLILKRLGCLSGYLRSSTSVQKLFCGSCSTCRYSSDVFVGEKVVLPLRFLRHLGRPPRDYCTKWSKRKTNVVWYHLHVKSKKDTNEIIYKTEIEPHT